MAHPGGGDRATDLVLLTTSPAYTRTALGQLRAAFRVSRARDLGTGATLVELDDSGYADLLDACVAGRLPFVQHVAPVHGRIAETPGSAAYDAALRAAAADVLGDVDAGSNINVQAWGDHPDVTAARRTVESVARAAGHETVKFGASRSLSLHVGTETVLGLHRPAATFADWPGGRLRLGRSKDRISRSEFKLEELFILTGLEVHGSALDLGAAPGGWTRILLTRGARHVVAVDPGDLDPRVARLPEVEHVRGTSAQYLRTTQQRFDVVVNDMKMEPQLSVDVVLDAAQAMKRGGLVVLTLKVTPANGAVSAERALERLAGPFDVVFCRQLHHNRNEVTVAGRLR